MVTPDPAVARWAGQPIEGKGKAGALLMILKRHGLTLTDEQQHQIATCTDLATLDRWLDRALSATSVDELLA